MRILIILSILIGSVCVKAQTQSQIYRPLIESGIYHYFKKLNQNDAEQFSIQDRVCVNEYAEILAKKEMRIHYAFGYFDESNGKNEDGTYSEAIDEVAFDHTSKWLTRICHPSEGHALCGFQKQILAEGYHLYLKEIHLFGQAIAVKIYMTRAAASPMHLENTGRLKVKQQQLTEQSEYNFFDGISKADIVIYNGHARDGGGPDFQPPVLRKDLHPNYDGHYKVKQVGYKKLLAALEDRPHKNQVLGLFACYTDKHFSDGILDVNPDQRMIVSRRKPDFFTATEVSLGYLDGFLEGLCAEKVGERAREPSVIGKQEYLDLNF